MSVRRVGQQHTLLFLRNQQVRRYLSELPPPNGQRTVAWLPGRSEPASSSGTSWDRRESPGDLLRSSVCVHTRPLCALYRQSKADAGRAGMNLGYFSTSPCAPPAPQIMAQPTSASVRPRSRPAPSDGPRPSMSPAAPKTRSRPVGVDRLHCQDRVDLHPAGSAGQAAGGG